MRTPTLLPTQSPASTETPLVLLRKKQPHSAENQPGAGSTPCGQAGLRRSAPVPRRDAQQRHKGENEPLWRPTACKWGVFCTGGIWSFFCPFLICPFAVGLLQPHPAAKLASRVPAARRRCAPRRLIPDVSGSFPSQTQVWIPFQSPPVQPCIFPVD